MAKKFLTENDLSSATEDALAKAKASGKFDGPQGEKGDTGADGVGIQSIYITEV